jgi:hypothetical protein
MCLSFNCFFAYAWINFIIRILKSQRWWWIDLPLCIENVIDLNFWIILTLVRYSRNDFKLSEFLFKISLLANDFKWLLGLILGSKTKLKIWFSWDLMLISFLSNPELQYFILWESFIVQNDKIYSLDPFFSFTSRWLNDVVIVMNFLCRQWVCLHNSGIWWQFHSLRQWNAFIECSSVADHVITINDSYWRYNVIWTWNMASETLSLSKIISNYFWDFWRIIVICVFSTSSWMSQSVS